MEEEEKSRLRDKERRVGKQGRSGWWVQQRVAHKYGYHAGALTTEEATLLVPNSQSCCGSRSIHWITTESGSHAKEDEALCLGLSTCECPPPASLPAGWACREGKTAEGKGDGGVPALQERGERDWERYRRDSMVWRQRV